MPTLTKRVWSVSHNFWLCPGTDVTVLNWEDDGSAKIRVGTNLITYISHEDASEALDPTE